MLIGKIKKELICTVKDPVLESVKFFMVKILNKHLKEENRCIISLENRLGLGVGDIVLIVLGSGARKLKGNKDFPVDCAITARVEKINIDKKYN